MGKDPRSGIHMECLIRKKDSVPEVKLCSRVEEETGHKSKD